MAVHVCVPVSCQCTTSVRGTLAAQPAFDAFYLDSPHRVGERSAATAGLVPHVHWLRLLLTRLGAASPSSLDDVVRYHHALLAIGVVACSPSVHHCMLLGALLLHCQLQSLHRSNLDVFVFHPTYNRHDISCHTACYSH